MKTLLQFWNKHNEEWEINITFFLRVIQLTELDFQRSSKIQHNTSVLCHCRYKISFKKLLQINNSFFSVRYKSTHLSCTDFKRTEKISSFQENLRVYIICILVLFVKNKNRRLKDDLALPIFDSVTRICHIPCFWLSISSSIYITTPNADRPVFFG